MNDSKAAVIGSVFSIVGLNVFSFAEVLANLSSALLYGALGALGGWLMNRLIKKIEKKRGSKDKI